MDNNDAKLAAAVYLAQCQRRSTIGSYARGFILAASQILTDYKSNNAADTDRGNHERKPETVYRWRNC